MINISDLTKLENENYYSYIWRMDNLIRSGKYQNWEEITLTVNNELFGDDEPKYKGESAFRKEVKYARNFYEARVFTSEDNYCKELQVQKRELERKKIQFRDERNAWQKQNFTDARVEQKLDYLENVLSNQGKVNFNTHDIPVINSDNDLLVILSDTHIGQCFSSVWGEYNSDIARDRLDKYLKEIISIKNLYNSEKCYISLQGDLISGSIHKTIQISNRENVIEQIKLAVELISSFCYEITKEFSQVYLYNISGNHSRIDKKDDSIHNERLDDLIGWNVGRTLDHIANFHMVKHRNLDIGIADMNIRGKSYIAVHGDFDGYNKSGVLNLSSMLGFFPYAVVYGHLHHCSADESNGIKMIRGGSLSGSGDDYTIEKRLSGKPSQMVCVCTTKGVRAYLPVALT